MNSLRHWILIFVSFWFLFLKCNSTPVKKSNDYYLLVSFDGFRWDYLDKVKSRGRETPNFDYIISSGVKAKHMKNTFTTTTWPNHWSMATGMHAESHGIVANSFYDPVLNDYYDSPNTPDSKWYNNGSEGAGGEPIWVTYEAAAKDHYSGAAVWPASTTPINGRVPTYKLPQDNEGISDQVRVDAIIEWFTAHKNPAHLGLLYFDEPDDTGHDFGPDSKETEDKIVEMDTVLGYLIYRLKEKDLFDRVNMIVTSDHGMLLMNQTYRLDDYVDPALYKLSGETPTLMFNPTEGNEEKLVAALKTVPHSVLYKKEDIPREYFYTYNNRILSYVLMMEDGYRTCCYNGSAPLSTIADHGYNNSHPSMWPFFIAHGPAFKSGYIAEPFRNIDIYPLMCHLLGIEPHPNNGSLDDIRHILVTDGYEITNLSKNEGNNKLKKASRTLFAFAFMFTLAGIVTLLYFVVYKKGKRRSRSSSELQMNLPTPHPEYTTEVRNCRSQPIVTNRNDKTWLLDHDSGSDVEEYSGSGYQRAQLISTRTVAVNP